MPIKAVQQFQLGTVLGTAQQASATLNALKKAGYQGIELCNFMIHPTPFLVRAITKAAGMPVGNGGKLDWKQLIADSGLQVPGVHQYLNSVEQNPDAAIAEAKQFGAKYIVITGMYRFDYTDPANVAALAKRLNEAGAVLGQSGIGLLYHNHNVEFCRMANGQRAYEYLMENTDPAAVNFEFDSYWAADAGANALAIMQKLGNRLRLYHINDRGCRQKGAAMTPILKMDSMEPGTGCMDLPPLIEAARAANVDAVILESHRNWIDGSPIRSFQLSAEFLNRYI